MVRLAVTYQDKQLLLSSVHAYGKQLYTLHQLLTSPAKAQTIASFMPENDAPEDL